MNLRLLLKTARQLGIAPLVQFGVYRLALHSGIYARLRCPSKGASDLQPVLRLPTSETLNRFLGEEEKSALRLEADSILEGKIRLFGGLESSLDLNFGSPLQHWTQYERAPAALAPWFDSRPNFPRDIKFLWEPARFSWVFPLGRAYRVFREEPYAAAFWRYFETFDQANPPCMGPHWMNGQEVALRLLALLWAGTAFADAESATPTRRARLAASVAEHAVRIPSTLCYARAQNNNHLLSETAALLAAALALPAHPDSPRWRRLGEKGFNRALEKQIDETGEYIQHSVTYHRLMLHLALWVAAMETARGEALLSARARGRLAAAADWLAARVDSLSGDAPNLGGNDGANLFPLAFGGYREFRPVAQAASRAFAGDAAFPSGAWDELSLWFGSSASAPQTRPSVERAKLSRGSLRVFLRVVNGNLRLGHADMLHADLWYRGKAFTLDPGTYLYNGAPPWQNPWAAARFHNTVTVDGEDIMTRAGKYLYLDWARTRLLTRDAQCLAAEHEGYRRLGVLHRREIRLLEGNALLVEDTLSARQPHRYRLHWLLPDEKWEISQEGETLTLTLRAEGESLTLRVRGASGRASLVRSGIRLWGEGEPNPVEGWFSPTYGIKLPALSLSLESFAKEGVQFVTEFHFSA